MAASNINLLPIDLSAKSGVAKTAALLRRVSMFGLVVFMVLGVMAGVFVVIYSIQLNSVITGNQALASQISTLEVTEQKTVLVKDRLQKIKNIEAQADVLNSVAGLTKVDSSLPQGVTIADVAIDALGKTSFSFNVTDSSSLANFLGSLIVSGNYKQLTIKSFTFAPQTGYLVSFEAVSK